MKKLLIASIVLVTASGILYGVDGDGDRPGILAGPLLPRLELKIDPIELDFFKSIWQGNLKEVQSYLKAHGLPKAADIRSDYALLLFGKLSDTQEAQDDTGLVHEPSRLSGIAHAHVSVENTLPEEVICFLGGKREVKIAPKKSLTIATSPAGGTYFSCSARGQMFDTFLFPDFFTISPNLFMGQECAAYGHREHPTAYIIEKHKQFGFWGGQAACGAGMKPELVTIHISPINYAILAYYVAAEHQYERLAIIQELFNHHASLKGESILRSLLYKLTHGAQNICKKIACGLLAPAEFVEILQQRFPDKKDRGVKVEQLLEQVRRKLHGE